MKKRKRINDIFKRAFKTFIQAFIGALAISMANVSTIDKTFVRSALIGAVASGVSALMNYINNLMCKEE